MIQAVLIFNNNGKPRLSKFYQHCSEEIQQLIIRETYQLVSRRDDNVCNFLETGTTHLKMIGRRSGEDAGPDDDDYKLIYRHYATLYFIFCCDSSESELGILDLIQVFVETLDKVFENVCELDLIFHVDKVHHVLDEIIMGGMVLETNMQEILFRIQEQEKLEKSEGSTVNKALQAAAPSKAISAVKELNLSRKLKDLKLPDMPFSSSSSRPGGFNIS